MVLLFNCNKSLTTIVTKWVIAIALIFSGSFAQANGSQFLESYRDPSNPQIIFAVFDYASTEGGVYLLHSWDGGQTYQKVTGPKGSAVRKHGRQDMGDFFVSIGPPSNPRLFITYGAEALWRAGPDLRWQKYAAPGSFIERLVPTAHPDSFFAILKGETGSTLFRTDTGGTSWRKLNDKLPFDCLLGICEIQASQDGKVLVGEGYISEDGGKTWKRLPPDQKTEGLIALQQARQRPWPITGTPDQIKAAELTVKSTSAYGKILDNPVVPNGKLGEFRHGTFPSPPLGDYTHVGVDIVAPCGSNIYAFADGRVKDIIDNPSDGNFKTLGYIVIIEHPDSLIGKTFYTLYLHMQGPPEVKIGTQVKGGSTVIGKMGNTGKVIGGCHTHFEIRFFPERLSAWGNIYGPGDQRASKYFKQNWEDPVTFFEKYPKGITLSQKQEDPEKAARITMKDGSTFTGTITPSEVKFKTKYGEIGIKTDTIVSFSKGSLILKDGSSLIGNFSSGNITIETATAKLAFPALEVISLTTEAITIPSKPPSIPSQPLTPLRKLTRDEAKTALRNLKIPIKWCIIDRYYQGKSANIPANPLGLVTDLSYAKQQQRIEISGKAFLSYLSLLKEKNLIEGLGLLDEKERRAKLERGGWHDWLVAASGMQTINLTEMGQKYLNKKFEFELEVIVNEITGIQFMKEETAAKVFFTATFKSSDNPFNQCFEEYLDIQSLLKGSYALFELFDDGWRFQKWTSEGFINEKEQTTKVGVEREIQSKPPLKKEIALEAALRQEKERIDKIEGVRKEGIIPLQANGVKAMKDHNWNAAIEAYSKLLEMDPENYQANVNIGGAYAMLNEFDQSLHYLSKANQLIPADPHPYVNMVYAYARKGDKDRAMGALQNAIDKGYKNLSHLKKDTDLPEDFRQDPRFRELTGLTLAKLTASIKDASFFDDHFREFPYRYEDVWPAVEQVLNKQGEKIIQSDKETGFIVTDLTRHGILGFPTYTKYYILLEKITENSCKLSFKLFAYSRVMEGRGATELILRPQSKALANKRGTSFLESINEALKKNK